MKVAVLVLFASFFDSATACYSSNDCPGSQSCCSDYVCRSSCYGFCDYDSDCADDECCNSDGYCTPDCPYLTTGGIIAAICGSLIFVAIVVFIGGCFCCACCPYYRYRHPGTVIVTGQPLYEQFVTTTTSTTSQHMQQPPPAAYGQPPPYHPQPQAGPYPPPQAQAQYPYGPASAAGQPIKQ